MEEEKKQEKKRARSAFWKGAFAGAAAAVVVACIIIGGLKGQGGSVSSPGILSEYGDEHSGPGVAENGAASEDGLDRTAIAEKIDMLQYAIDEYFLFDEDFDKVEAGIYKGMVSGLDDPYTEYYTPEEYAELTEETEGVYCGIGVQVSQNRQTGIITALRVFPGSPAQEAGMQKGDLIYKVGDLMASEQDLDVLVSQHIRGEEGTWVDITVLRGQEEIALHVQRRIVETQTVEYELLEGNTGYILVTQFELNTSQQFKEAIDDLTAKGMERLVIDLRDNPGGVVDACVDMAAYILPEEPLEGTILSTQDKNGKGLRYYCQGGKLRFEATDGGGTDSRYPRDDGHQVDVPIAVLMNGYSASASEVFAGALRDYGKATLVGTTSFGKGIVQSLLPLNDGSALKITVSHYYTPSGYDLHGKGLTPDVEIEQELDEDLVGQYEIPKDRDNQLRKAIEVLMEQ